jgi:hypothetical protein
MFGNLGAESDLVLVDARNRLPGFPSDDGRIERRDERRFQVSDGVESRLGRKRLNEIVTVLVTQNGGDGRFVPCARLQFSNVYLGFSGRNSF